MRNITIETQIKALNTGLTLTKAIGNSYVCIHVNSGLSALGYHKPMETDISEYIPLFTFENAIMVCRKHKLKLPVGRANSGGWWDKGVKKPRLAFVNWMIRQLETQAKEINKQIELLEAVKTKIINRTELFICNGIQDILFDKGIIDEVNYGSFDPSVHISICTRENAKLVCIEAGVIEPFEYLNSWWYYDNPTSRVVFIDWMVKQLKEQL